MEDLLTVEGILGARGALAAALPGFEFRPEQLAVAQAVEEAFAERRHLLAEAGTGTGKTLAYLVPAILSGRKVVVSTATKNLQEQLFFKDVPLLREALGLRFEAAYLKGRTNHLCLHRFEAKAAAPKFDTPEDAARWPAIAAWAERTETGDRAELSLPEDFAGWAELTSTSDTCLGQRCPAYESCFVFRMRRLAEAADIVVVNHHLFFADLALRSRPGMADVGVLPRYDVVVFDEAHALEDIATEFFGSQVSNYRLEELAADAQRALGERDPGHATLAALASRVRWHADDFFRHARDVLRPQGEAALRLTPQSLAGVEALDELLSALAALGAFAGNADTPELLALHRRSGEIAEQLEHIVRADSPAHVYWAEARGRGLFLRSAPIDVGPDLRRRLFASIDTAIFTSATLTADGRFDYFARRMGLAPVDEGDEPPPFATISVPSPFDYPNQAALYVPAHLPDPNSPDFVHAVAEEVVALTAITGGRAFVLFTSLRNMEAAWRSARTRLPYQVLLQGERPKSALLEAFRQEPSVLFASHSFWEGVDVPGDALSLVVIDKLPFASPGDPRIAARIDHLRERGEEPFATYQLPSAAIALRQGFGRLIRSSRDRGIVALLDPRLTRRGYGRAFLRSLPPAHRVTNLTDLRTWFSLVPARAAGR